MSDTTITLTNAGDPNPGAPTASEPSAAEVDAAMGIEPRLDEDFTRDQFTAQPTNEPWVHPMKKHAAEHARRLRQRDQFLPAKLRAKFALDTPGAPEAVLEAQRAGYAAVNALEEAERRMASLPDDIEQHTAAHALAAGKAHRAGEPAPILEPRDWIAEGAARAIDYSESVKAAEEAVVAFNRAKEDAQEAWLATLIDLIPEALEEARTAVHAAAKALRHHRATVDAADTLARATGAYGYGWHQDPAPVNKVTAMAGIADLLALVDPANPVTTGEHLTRIDDDALLEPPAWTRAALERRAEKRPGGEDFVMLAQIREADSRGEVAPCAKGKQLSSPGVVPVSNNRFDII